MTTVSSTRMHDQGETFLPWVYAAASSIRKSLRIRIGKVLIYVYGKTNFDKASLPNHYAKDEALKFIDRGGHHQILRKEIIFALRPTTLTGSIA